MEEIKLIKKLESLKELKPSENWVFCAKGNILANQFEKDASVSFASVFNYLFSSSRVMVPALCSVITLVFGFGVYTAAANSMPGDRLYAVKHAIENVKMSMKSGVAQSVAKVNQAEQRLTDLDNITKQSENQGNRLAAGISEVQKALSVASKELKNIPESQKAGLVENIVSKISKIEKTTNASIIDNESSDYQEIYKLFIESEIKELTNNENNLTDEQKDLLSQAKESFDVHDYNKAVELIYQIQPQINN